MTQIAFSPPISVERMVASSVQAATTPPPKERVAAYRDNITGLELFCSMPQAREVNPARYRLLHAYTKTLQAALQFELLQVEVGGAEPMRPFREELADLIDRADELMDTFALAANVDELLPALEAEMQLRWQRHSLRSCPQDWAVATSAISNLCARASLPWTLMLRRKLRGCN